jgi:hypothetical protein
MVTNIDMNTQNMQIDERDELEEALMHNMIEAFMNISDEDNKIFNYLKDEFKEDLKVLQYGSIMLIQNDLDIEHFPNISELLQIYEEIFTNLNMKSSLSLRLEKCKKYIIYIYIYIYRLCHLQ